MVTKMLHQYSNMVAKQALLCGFLLLILLDFAQSEFLYNRVLPKQEELLDLGLRCIPGRTTIKMSQQNVGQKNLVKESSASEEVRRNHMRFSTDDESCQICVCSMEGKDEHCSKRPAMNVNECMRMAVLTSNFNRNQPFDHERSLSNRIRRDYIWHNDEIPYDPHARCQRAHSYYTNSINANDTDVDVASDIVSLLDYPNTSVCFYCVCSLSGDNAGCLPRSPWFCQYYRNIIDPSSARDRYRTLFQQDRPAYFRHISWRLRRTMDDGMFDLIDNGGDSLCCAHPDGHRRQMHHQVRTKIKMLKKKINRENLMSNKQVGDGQKCTPFVSAYTDCTEENKCTGCHRCSCNVAGTWECKTITHPCGEDDLDEDHRELDDQMIRSALDEILTELQVFATPDAEGLYVPPPKAPQETKLIETDPKEQAIPQKWDAVSDSDENILDLMKSFRRKRSVTSSDNEKNINRTVVFHHTVDEINEDTLQNSSASGTLPAAKIDPIPAAFRRSSPLNNYSTPLQIKYLTKEHSADNKIDTTDIHDDKEDLLVHHQIYEVVGNKGQATRDNTLSKVVVNELKEGKVEFIGDKNAPIISNITFTPDNDTLTAMAFIAGNLLHKLWNMEKDGENSMETEHMKHKKINDLLELFKEPLNQRQETFLKNALQHLSSAIETKNVVNISLCENIDKIKNNNKHFDNKEKSTLVNSRSSPESEVLSGLNVKENSEINQADAAAAALYKINNILNLIEKFENNQNLINVAKNVSNMKSPVTKSLKTSITEDEQNTLNVFGHIIQSLTKLIVPYKESKITMKRTNKNFLNEAHNLKQSFSTLNLADLVLTTKDKFVLDYIKHIQNSPKCLFKTEMENKSNTNIEGDILLNLAEFLKIKSISDLMLLVNANKTKPDNVLRTTASTNWHNNTVQNTITTSPSSISKSISSSETIKGKLKSHIKNILQDIIDLQNVTGKLKDGNKIHASDILPCLNKLLYNKEEYTSNKVTTEHSTNKNPISKIFQVIDNLKTELNKSNIYTRRNYGTNEARPKSAVVWERAVKNIGDKIKLTRRNIQSTFSDSISDIRKQIEKIDSSGSDTYKSIAYLAEIPATERLLLLKTFAADTNKYLSVMNNIKEFIEASTAVPVEDYKTLSEFIENANLNSKLNSKVINKVNTPDLKVLLSNRVKEPTKSISIFDIKTERNERKPDFNSLKLTRDQIINQLMKNKLLKYLKLKEGSSDSKDITNYKLAERALFYLEMGNTNLAGDLFKIFSSRNKKMDSEVNHLPINPVSGAATIQPIPGLTSRSRLPVPLIQFEELERPRPTDKDAWLNQENLLRQLINVKDIKMR